MYVVKYRETCPTKTAALASPGAAEVSIFLLNVTPRQKEMRLWLSSLQILLLQIAKFAGNHYAFLHKRFFTMPTISALKVRPIMLNIAGNCKIT